MRNNRIKGTGVALITPFKEDSAIDFEALEKLLDYVINNGVDYIVVSGTTGEPSSMSSEEKQSLRNFIIEKNANRVPLVLGIGGNCTNAVISEIKNTDLSNFDSILSVSPYYVKPNQRGIYQHFAAIAKESPLPIILYNVPGRTSRNIDVNTVLELANNFQNIVAIKEASGNMAQVMEIVNNKPEDFMVISGDDALTVPMISVGVQSVISVAANVVPKQYTKMINAALSGDFVTASQLHYQLLNLMNALFEDGSPAGAKAALANLGFIKDTLRLPLVQVNNQVQQKIIAETQKIIKL